MYKISTRVVEHYDTSKNSDNKNGRGHTICNDNQDMMASILHRLKIHLVGLLYTFGFRRGMADIMFGQDAVSLNHHKKDDLLPLLYYLIVENGSNFVSVAKVYSPRPLR